MELTLPVGLFFVLFGVFILQHCAAKLISLFFSAK
jgi:hypothetical protein